MPLQAVVRGLEVRNLDRDCSPSRLEEVSACLCVTLVRGCRKEDMNSSLGVNLASELDMVE